MSLQGKHKQLVERVRRMSAEVAPQEVTDTPSLSLRSKCSFSGRPSHSHNVSHQHLD